METFTDTMGDFVMNRLLPRSDGECTWNYAKSICVPRCDCSFQHKAGDLTMSRACRLSPPEAAREACDPDISGERGALEKLGDGLQNRFRRWWYATNEFLHDAAPPTDDACDWNWRLRSCDPPRSCSLQYTFGDYHIGRACRLTEYTTDDVHVSMDDDPPSPIEDDVGGDAFQSPKDHREPPPLEDDSESEAPDAAAAAPYGFGDDDRDAAW